jgi:hypothetical protein
MYITYRLVDPKGELLSDADTIEYLKGILGHLDVGRYVVDEIASVPLPSGRTARRWGVLLNLDDGTIIGELDPWDEYSLA